MKGYMGLACLAVSYSFCWTPPRYQLLTSGIHQQSIAYIFAHGLGANHTQACKLFKPQDKNSILCGPVGIFDFPDAKPEPDKFHKKYVNLGQNRDIERLSYACDRTLEATNCDGVVLAGISRGSATILNYAALNTTVPIKAIIAESPFDSLKNIVKHLLKRFHVAWVPFSKKIGMKLADAHFPELDVYGLFPIDTVANIDKNIPILLIYSPKDKVIPLISSLILYVALREAGHEHVYLLELSSGDHGKLMLSSEASKYQNVVHAFYKKYNLPYNAKCALQGEALLEQCQPSIEVIKKRIHTA